LKDFIFQCTGAKGWLLSKLAPGRGAPSVGSGC